MTPIFEHSADGWAREHLADWLNEQGTPIRERGGGWAMSTVRQIVRSRVYLGEIRSGDVVNEAAHEPLVDLGLWQRANTVNKTPQRRPAGQFVLSGLVRCASCGVTMKGRSDTVTTASGEEHGDRYYAWRVRYSFGRCPEPARVRADEIEEPVDRAVQDQFITGWTGRPAASTEELLSPTATRRCDVPAHRASFPVTWPWHG